VLVPIPPPLSVTLIISFSGAKDTNYSPKVLDTPTTGNTKGAIPPKKYTHTEDTETMTSHTHTTNYLPAGSILCLLY